MNKEIKEKWVQALRSGEYKQGKFALCSSNSYCCLGVLCDLHSKQHNLHWEKKSDYTNIYLGHACSLPKDVYKWAEIDFCPSINEIPLMTINDVEGKNFNEIADLIEKYL